MTYRPPEHEVSKAGWQGRLPPGWLVVGCAATLLLGANACSGDVGAVGGDARIAEPLDALSGSTADTRGDVAGPGGAIGDGPDRDLAETPSSSDGLPADARDARSADAADGSSIGPADAGAPADASGRNDAATANPVWDWVGVVGTGQSLSVGDHGTPVSLTTQRFGNLKLSLGNATVPPFDPANPALSMVPLVEPIRALAPSYPGAYPRNIFGETPHTSMANQISTLFQTSQGGSYVTVHTVVGESGQPMTVIRKGATDTGTTGRAYAATLFEAAAIARLAASAGKSYGIGAIVITHGEADATSTTYANDLFQLWSDYNQDLRPLTRQTTRIPMLVSQQNSTPWGLGVRSASTLAEWRVGVDHPGDIICSGPKYQYRYATDFTHLANPREYERLGEKLGEVFFEKVVLGRDWRPLEPDTVERAGRVITVHFHVPVPPLVWDAVLPRPHLIALTEWAPGRGFELRAGATRIAIAGVQIAGDSVQITAAADLPASGVVVGYAMSADDNPMPGGTQRWGQLRDSDPFVGATTVSAQPNFSVAFELTVP